ncbi:hypothetical protein ACM26S_06735 [Kluyvera sichuanensis]|uniref:hypothetical protein n=1 Tax=Kluyvera sichuanensis TaxID=2725494 RepID=UPI0039F65524
MMKKSFILDCAVKICSADHVSGYISINPVIDTRDKLTEQRLNLLYDLIYNVSIDVINAYPDIKRDEVAYVFDKAIQLTSSDISCGAIAVEPVLYERDQKIFDTIKFYFMMVNEMRSSLAIELENNEISSPVRVDQNLPSCPESRTIVIPVYQKMKRAKIKKGKR